MITSDWPDEIPACAAGLKPMFAQEAYISLGGIHVTTTGRSSPPELLGITLVRDVFWYDAKHMGFVKVGKLLGVVNVTSQYDDDILES
jgi:hypothetical protein